MPSYNLTLETWSNVSGGVTWSNPGNAQVLDGVTASAVQSFGPVPPAKTSGLQGAGPSTFSPSPNEQILSLAITVTRSSTSSGTVDYQILLVKAGTPLAGSNRASAAGWPATLTTVGYTWSAADLAGLGIGISDIQNSGFGAYLVATIADFSTAYVDQIALTLNTAYLSAGGSNDPQPAYAFGGNL